MVEPTAPGAAHNLLSYRYELMEARPGSPAYADAREMCQRAYDAFMAHVKREPKLADLFSPVVPNRGPASPQTQATSYVLMQIAEERARQDARWGGPSHDDKHTAQDWETMIAWYSQPRSGPFATLDTNEFRARMRRVGALAIAATQWSYRLDERMARQRAALAEIVKIGQEQEAQMPPGPRCKRCDGLPAWVVSPTANKGRLGLYSCDDCLPYVMVEDSVNRVSKYTGPA